MRQKLLLCTDLDRTLLPNGKHPESGKARDVFRRLALQPQLTLAYVTGRHLTLVERVIKLYQLPVPDFIIADVGTTIYSMEEGKWQRMKEWDDEIADGWEGMSHADLKSLFNDMKELRLQESNKQNIHKLSYYVSLEIDHGALITMMKSRLDKRGVRASLIWSVDEPTGIGLLDVLPVGTDKRHAIEFLMYDQDFHLGNTVFAGDSGNDFPVLVSPIHSVLVANASESVKADARKQADEAGFNNALYIARGGFQQMNGNYSAGILEGVVHYIPEVEQWLNPATS